MFNKIYYNAFNSKIYLWETINGKKIYNTYDFEHDYYIEDKTQQSDITDIYGVPMVHRTASKADEVKQIINSGIKVCEADISPTFRFLEKRYGKLILDSNIDNFNVCFWDIENEIDNSPNDPMKSREFVNDKINLITCYFTKSKKIYTFGLHEYTGNSSEVTNYYWIPDEKTMLEKFITIFKKENPDAISGWFSSGYDNVYFINRCKKLDIKKSLSPINKYYLKKNGTYNIAGIADLDYIELYKKFTYDTKTSYTLNNIGLIETGEGKIEYEGTIKDFYKSDWNRFVEYNIQDTMLVKKIDDVKKFIELTLNICSQAFIPYDSIFSTIATHTGIAMHFLHENNMVMPLRNINVQKEEYPGGYVEAHPGLYQYVISFDVESLYPNLIIRDNVGPETIRYNPRNTDKLLHTPLSKETIWDTSFGRRSYGGIYYDMSQKSVLVRIVEKFITERRVNKNKMKICQQIKDTDDINIIAENSLVSVEYATKLIDDIHNEDGNKDYYNSQQQIWKILINSLYGALGNEYFHFYNPLNAMNITLSGQHLIKYLSNCFNEYFKNYFWKDKNYFPIRDEKNKLIQDVVILIDTDSCVGDTNIKTNNNIFTISKLFDKCDNIEEYSNGKFIGTLPEIYETNSFNKKTKNIEIKKINYVMKHKVKKKMYKIGVYNANITCTADHSIIVKRDNVYIDISPCNIIKGDILIKRGLFNEPIEIDDFKIKCLGEIEDYVYDIEVEDNHNFFGNDILVHNSNYICVNEVIEKLGLTFNTTDEFLTWGKIFINNKINPLIDKILNIYAKKYQGTKQIINFKREKIIDRMFITGKKHYAVTTLDKEGKTYKTPKMDITGIETKKSSTAQFAREKMENLLMMIFNGSSKDEVLDELREMKKEFITLPIHEIACPGRIKEYDKYAKPGEYYIEHGIKYIKGTPKRHKAGINYNYFVCKLNLKLLPITNGTKIYYVAVKKHNSIRAEVIGFIGKYPEEFKDIFDINYEFQWDTVVMKMAKKWFEVMNWGEPILRKNNLRKFFKKKK